MAQNFRRPIDWLSNALIEIWMICIWQMTQVVAITIFMAETTTAVSASSNLKPYGSESVCSFRLKCNTVDESLDTHLSSEFNIRVVFNFPQAIVKSWPLVRLGVLRLPLLVTVHILGTQKCTKKEKRKKCQERNQNKIEAAEIFTFLLFFPAELTCIPSSPPLLFKFTMQNYLLQDASRKA